MLAEILHKVAAQEYQQRGDSRYYPRPSLAGPERCIRQMVYWRLGVPATPLPGRGVMVFDDSIWHEQLTGDWIRKSAYDLHSEQMKVTIKRDPYKFVLHGKIDGILQDMLGKEFHLEHKAVSHFSWVEMAKGNAHADMVAQDCMYLDGLREVAPHIEDSLLLVKNKNTAQYLEFLITYAAAEDVAIVKSILVSGEGMEPVELNREYKGIIEDSFAKFQKVEDYASQNTIPKRQYERDHWRCQYCQYHETCWANYEEEFHSLATGVDLSEIEDVCAGYLRATASSSEIKKEKDGLKAQIKKVLEEKGAREGIAGKYIVKNTLSSRTEIDQDLIPNAILAVCERTVPSERFTVREVKKK